MKILFRNVLNSALNNNINENDTYISIDSLNENNTILGAVDKEGNDRTHDVKRARLALEKAPPIYQLTEMNLEMINKNIELLRKNLG